MRSSGWATAALWPPFRRPPLPRYDDRVEAKGTLVGRLLGASIALSVIATPAVAVAACAWGYPVGDDPSSPLPLSDNHPVGGMNLPDFGSHLGADFWSGGGCTDLGETVYAVADGEVVEIVDGLGSYLDVVVIRHDDPALGPIYSMYGHIARDAGLSEGAAVQLRDPIGTIDDVLAYFSPCHLHFELLSEAAYAQGPFCNGCEAAGFNVSPGYDQQAGVTPGTEPSGETYLDVNDGIDGNRWYHAEAFIDPRLDAVCGRCGDATCNAGESYDNCPQDCPPCALIPPSGTTLDESGPCFSQSGDPQYWNYERGIGNDGSLQWTHTTDSEIIDNYGVWDLAFEDGGMYQLDVHVPAGSADTQQARYVVTHAGQTESIVADQSQADGWLALGELAFAAGGGQSVRLDDNTGEPFSGMTRIVFDAVRLTRLDAPAGDETGESGGTEGGTGEGTSGESGSPADTGGGDSSAETSDATSGNGAALPGGTRGSSDGCACSTGPGSPRLPAALLVLVALCATRRRRPTPPH